MSKKISIFRIEKTAENEIILWGKLPKGKTQQELVFKAAKEISRMTELFYGCSVKINGVLTDAINCMLGHALSNVCRSVSVFDPKENAYILCIYH